MGEKLHGFEEKAEHFENETRALLDCSKGMVERLKKQQKQLHELQAQQAAKLVVETTGAPYGQAATLFSQGVSLEQITKRYGISRGEAELIEHLARLERQAEHAVGPSVNSLAI
jgi:hypothetical protein